ncbi:MAG: hypothetical protein R3324_21950 [Halobacteriales archaeon]|nr:hypothetical protein [Halobacteriales archaeon]
MALSRSTTPVRARLLRLPRVGTVNNELVKAVGLSLAMFSTIAVTVASHPLTPVFVRLIVFTLAAGVALSFFGLGLVIREQVTVAWDDRLTVALDHRTGLVRHGRTSREALECLNHALAVHDPDVGRSDPRARP